jgi:hypothetical protein
MRTTLLIYLFLITAGCTALPSQKIGAAEFQVLTGKQWTGALTYLDYGNGQKTTIASILLVSQSTDNQSKWVFDYQYPDEPRANKKSELLLGLDGATFDGNKVVEKTYLPDKTLKLVMEKNDKDNNKVALLRYTYLFNETKFSIKKEVKYDGTNEFLERNEFSWKR